MVRNLNLREIFLGATISGVVDSTAAAVVVVDGIVVVSVVAAASEVDEGDDDSVTTSAGGVGGTSEVVVCSSATGLVSILGGSSGIATNVAFCTSSYMIALFWIGGIETACCASSATQRRSFTANICRCEPGMKNVSVCSDHHRPPPDQHERAKNGCV